MNVATSKSEEETLLVGLKKGEAETLSKIYHTFFPPIMGLIKKQGGNEEDAKDVFQEGIMVMYRLVQKPEFKLSSSFLSLLYSICRNIWVKSLRKRPRYEDVHESAEVNELQDQTILDTINTRAIDTLFRKNLNQLGDQCRTILNLFFEGNSMKKIVENLKLSSISFAKKKKFQCKEKLVSLVKADPIYLELRT